MPFVDTHAHLNDEAFAPDLEAVLDRAAAVGVGRIIVPGYDLPSSYRAVALAGQYPALWATVGISPHDAKTWDETAAAALAGLAREEKVVGIGEIGLDYHYDLSPRDIQKEAFQTQVELAVSLGLPVIVHNREASSDTLSILGMYKNDLKGGAMHCFTGSPETALQAWSMGLRISLAGPLTFANAARLRQLAAGLPVDCLLAETDSPYLTPHPHRGRRNEPSMVALVTEALAMAQGKTVEEMAAIVWENAERTFRF